MLIKLALFICSSLLLSCLVERDHLSLKKECQIPGQYYLIHFNHVEGGTCGDLPGSEIEIPFGDEKYCKHSLFIDSECYIVTESDCDTGSEKLTMKIRFLPNGQIAVGKSTLQIIPLTTTETTKPNYVEACYSEYDLLMLEIKRD